MEYRRLTEKEGARTLEVSKLLLNMQRRFLTLCRKINRTMKSNAVFMGGKSAKAALLLFIYLMHFCSFQCLRANPKSEVAGFQQSTLCHTTGNKAPSQKKPYSAFIANHVVVSPKQHIENEFSVQLQSSDKNTPVLPQMANSQVLPANFNFATGNNKRFKFLHVYLI
jgi:hypothetical protein